ncbi:alpha/beta fold hydrolase [Dechloromonas sp. XY25]|uniref:Alpha/beta fold hydrolase n=1 Tax=Dechloromonas hankyongensis TaxID=2908002 RepID=A0ABS9JXA0_9RHOO|nr:YqiA/YcfP family alpha/beta fold hydrolase [Dechloromonas hankyongensis]MCG2575522.1 alpha/beta fold hydrolase [Dechloromonas hankyongensis]
MIIYLHGFCSSPASWKSRLLAEEMARRGLADHFVCPQLSPVPDEAVASVSRLIEQAGGPVTLVGSSLGGHYASHLAEKHGLNAVLINPAAVYRLDLADFAGEHANFHSGERFVFTAAHAVQLKAQVARPTPERYWLLLEEGDEVLDYRQAADFYAGCRQTVLPGGDHSFTQFPEFIPQIIEFAGL